MLYLNEYKTKPDSLTDLLPWAALVAPGIILNKDGSFQTSFRYRGPDLDSSTEAELISLSARINNVLRRFGSGYALYFDSERTLTKEYPKSFFPDSLTQLIDEERRANFHRESYFESKYYFTVVYLPPSEVQKKLSGFFLEKEKRKGVDYALILKSFEEEILGLEKLLQGVLPEIERLSDEELLTYLHSIVSEKRHIVAVPETPMYLDAILADSPLVAGFRPMLGEHHLSIVGVKGFPGKSHPVLLDRLNRLSLEYRWVTRFIALDKALAEGEISRFKKKWFAKRKGIVTLLKETLTGEQSVMADSDAVNKAFDSDAALEELLDDAVAYGYFTANVVLRDRDEERLTKNVREVEKVINGLGFATKVEDVNSVDAWLGAIPGNCRNNVRRPLLNTLNLAHLMPLSSVWSGSENDRHLNAPALFHAKTGGGSKFRYVLHVGDVGHTMVIGPTGAGKSVLLNFMEAQFRRYKGAQVYIFDKGGSSRTLTYGVGGDYYDLGSKGAALNFQPLSNIDESAELRWANEWILDLLLQEGVSLNPRVKELVWTALSSLATAPKKERTIFGLTVLLQDHTLRQALLPFTVQGAHGHLLDSTNDNLSYGTWQAFEMEEIMETPNVVLPLLTFLFHRLEKRFTGAPTLLVLDEAWLFLDNKAFASKIREWLKVLRKANVAVIFATQSLSDIDQSSIASTIKEACFSKIYLPNTAALNPDVFAFYKKFGLNETEIEILAQSIPKRQYYYTSPQGNRLFELALDDVALHYCGTTAKEDQARVVELKKRYEATDEFNHAWLKERGFDWAERPLEILGNGDKRL